MNKKRRLAARKGKRRPPRAPAPRPSRATSAKRIPAIDDSPIVPAERIFAGSRPPSMVRGLEPAFLLFDREILERVETRAAELGVRYQSLVKQIVRDHLDRY